MVPKLLLFYVEIIHVASILMFFYLLLVLFIRSEVCVVNIENSLLHTCVYGGKTN